jgi:hypothetical protein
VLCPSRLTSSPPDPVVVVALEAANVPMKRLPAVVYGGNQAAARWPAWPPVSGRPGGRDRTQPGADSDAALQRLALAADLLVQRLGSGPQQPAQTSQSEDSSRQSSPLGSSDASRHDASRRSVLVHRRCGRAVVSGEMPLLGGAARACSVPRIPSAGMWPRARSHPTPPPASGPCEFISVIAELNHQSLEVFPV